MRQAWIALALLIGLGCGCAHEETDIATVPVASGPGESSTRSTEQIPFVAYVQDTDDGGTQAVVYYPDQDRKEIVMTRQPGESRPHFWILPSDVTRSTPYRWRDGEVVEGNWAPSEHREVYLDSMSGKVVQPDAALGLDEYWRQQLIDLVGDRAVVLEYDTDCDPLHPTATVCLLQGTDLTELGRVFVERPMSSSLARHYSLSPDRNYLSWSGPGGSYWCDLRTKQVYAHERLCKWLPDSSGFVEQWKDLADTHHWKLFDGDSEQPVAQGEGHIREISPDGVCWAIVNEAWTRAKYREPDDPPRFVQLIPGREPSPETRIADGPWAIEGADARLFAAGWHSENETLLYRITPQGHVAFVLEGKSHGKPRVLQLEDGGRVGISLDDQLVILDFDGNERLRTEATLVSRARAHALLPAPSEGNFLCIAARTLGRWRVDRFNFITGGVETVLTCDAQSLEVHRIGNSYFAVAHHGKGKPPWNLQAPWDLYLGKQDGKHWQLLANNVHRLRWGPVE